MVPFLNSAAAATVVVAPGRASRLCRPAAGSPKAPHRLLTAAHVVKRHAGSYFAAPLPRDCRLQPQLTVGTAGCGVLAAAASVGELAEQCSTAADPVLRRLDSRWQQDCQDVVGAACRYGLYRYDRCSYGLCGYGNGFVRT